MTSQNMILIILAGIAASSLIVVGIAMERREAKRSIVASPPTPILAPTPTRAHSWRLRQLITHHPAPGLALLETAFWLGALVTLLMHLRDPENSPVAFAIWALIIGPHEIGHVVCMPFGWFLNVAGGSIWQIMVFVLPALYAFWARRLISGSLFFWVLTGHSLINLARYIDDARARDLPLLLGMSKDHHDWWNLLRELELLEYDHVIATLTEISGAVIIVLAAGVGTLSAWVLPRSGIGPVVRYEGRFWSALRNRLRDAE